MRRTAIILYGPPASGKDTITTELIRQDPCFVVHRRMKVGSGNTTGYRLGTLPELEAFREAGQVLYENARYGNIYAFITSQLEQDLMSGIPVLHVGQLAGVRALKAYPIQWTAVALWCSRETTRARAVQRGDSDIERRLVAWDETQADLAQARPNDFDMVLDNEKLSPDLAAGSMIRFMRDV